MNEEHVGPNVRKLRMARGWTLRQLAHHSGVAFSYVSDLESGSKRNISLRHAIGLSSALNVPLVRLLEPPVESTGLRSDEV